MGAGVAVIVNVASVPSVTLGGSAVIVITGVTPGMITIFVNALANSSG